MKTKRFAARLAGRGAWSDLRRGVRDDRPIVVTIVRMRSGAAACGSFGSWDNLRCGIVVMRLVCVLIVVLVLAVAAWAPAATAQSQSQLLRQTYSVENRTLLLRVAENRASIQQQLAKARAQERNSGCRRLFFRNRSSACRNIRARISSLERRLSRKGASGRRQNARSGLARYSRRTFRTICVRVCDGYYYSLSHTSSRRRFKRDAERCAGQYPPGEAVLFYHPFPGDDVSQARSLKGERYADQDYAFAFRKTFMPHCAAQLHQGLAALRSRVFAAVPTLLEEQSDSTADDDRATDTVPVALERPNRSSDPETLANRTGDLVPEPLDPHLAASMRIIGDPYHFAEANPGPPSTVPGYVPPELKDFRVKLQASALESARRRPGRSQEVPISGSY